MKNYIRKSAAVLFAVIIVVTLGISAIAATPRVVDDADILYNEDELEAEISRISSEYHFDIVIVTNNSLEGKTATAYADDYFDYNGYGYGDNRDGILLLVSIGERDWAISTRGYGITAFTDYGNKYISEQVTEKLSDKEYDDAAETFVNLCEDFLKEAKTNKPYDVKNKVTTTSDRVLNILIPVGIGIIIGFIVVSILKYQLKTVRSQPMAHQYIRDGSFQLRDNRDVFLYSNVSKTKRVQSSSGGSGSGGSSTHTSSSGASHGGSSGKF